MRTVTITFNVYYLIAAFLLLWIIGCLLANTIEVTKKDTGKTNWWLKVPLIFLSWFGCMIALLLATRSAKKTITVTLNPEQEKYFLDLRYTLMDIGMDESDSDAINHALMEVLLFEEFTGDQLTNWLAENYPKSYDVAINTRDFGANFKPQV